MRGKVCMSTISYNTKDFLVAKLDELVKKHTISFYMGIYHYAEADETKDHIHLYIQPNKIIDSMDLQDYLKEIDPLKPNKPLGCIDFRKSEPDEWILYDQHYAPYLASKFESREFCYTKEDFFSSDSLTFDDLYHHAFYGSKWAQRNQMLNAIKDSENNPINLINNGTIPLNLASQLNAYKYMQTHYGTLDRGYHENHEIDSDINVDIRGVQVVQSNTDELTEKDFFNDVIYRINR